MEIQDVKKIECPIMYKGFIIKNVLVGGNYKLEGINDGSGVYLKPLYGSFNQIKSIIDQLKS